MAEIDLVSSHTPWTPLPRMVPWDALGDGSVYDPQPAQDADPSVGWQDPGEVHRLYGESIEYAMTALFSFLITFDDPNLVIVVVGDHQPASIVSILSQNPSVIDRIDSWEWEPGMLPSSDAPRWRMDAFRDRFLFAYSRDDAT